MVSCFPSSRPGDGDGGDAVKDQEQPEEADPLCRRGCRRAADALARPDAQDGGQGAAKDAQSDPDIGDDITGRNWVHRNPTSQTMPVTIREMWAPLLAIEWRVFCVILWMAARASSASLGEMFMSYSFRVL